jgi:uncharacterized protein YfaT (DUF1175 family)
MRALIVGLALLGAPVRSLAADGVATQPVPPAAVMQSQREALARLALTQAGHPSGRWDPAQRDCAGFVRFLYANAVTGRAKMWKSRTGALTEYLRAEELLGYNFERVAGGLEAIKAGDLLAFHKPGKAPEDAWHLMVALTPPPGARQEVLLVYHNGATGKEGEVKQVWLGTLQFEREWAAWRPDAANPLFLGVFRWRGWEGA